LFEGAAFGRLLSFYPIFSIYYHALDKMRRFSPCFSVVPML